MAVQSLQTACQLPSIFLAVVYPCYQAVFKCNSPSCFIKIIPACLQKLIHTVFLGNRHQLLPLFIIWSMERYRKSHLKLLLCQLIHFRYKSAGGHSQIPLTEMKSAFLCKNMDKSQKIIIIIQRSSGSHDYNIGNSFPYGCLYPVDLIQHFRRQKISGKPSDGGCAESAAHSAACL